VASESTIPRQVIVRLNESGAVVAEGMAILAETALARALDVVESMS
jgi:hypothetical protein